MIDKNLIVMLTWHDVTVANTKELFSGVPRRCGNTGALKIEGTTPEAWRN